MKFPQHPLRLIRALGQFHKIIKLYKPDLAVIEDVAYGAPSRTTVVKLASLVTLLEVVLQSMNVPYLVVSPTLVRKWLCGKGNADKDVVAREIKARYGIEFENDKGHDLSDACALALCGLEQRK